MADERGTVQPDTVNGGFVFVCGEPRGCGTTVSGVHYPFSSGGWNTEEQAQARGAQHLEEHDTGIPAMSLLEAEQLHGFTGRDPGTVLTPAEGEK